MTRLAYLDSSVALRAALPSEHRIAWRRWMTDTADGSTFVAARLLQTEMVRTLRRERIVLAEATKVLSRVRLVAVTPDTFVLAEAVEQTIRTLDALHLAVAVQIGQALTVLTHDSTMRSVAESMGLTTFDPVGADGAPLPVPDQG